MQPINLSRFDSTAGVANINNSLEKSNRNDLLLTNISRKINFNDDFYTFDYNVLEKYKNYLSQFLIKVQCPEQLYYHPEIVAKKIYGTVDLWYLVMMFNPIPSVAEFNLPVINIFDPSKIQYINNIINTHQKEIKFNDAKPEYVEKHVLTPVRIKDTRLI